MATDAPVPLRAPRPAVLSSPGGHVRTGSSIGAGLREVGCDPVSVAFGGEISVVEIERIAASSREADPPVYALMVVGSGKCLERASAWPAGSAFRW